MDYLDAHQIARLECLKLAMAQRGRESGSTTDILADALIMARFVIDGIEPSHAPKPAERAAA